MRDGHEVITTLGQDLVSGDVVLLAARDLVPADGVSPRTQRFFVKEALLTGGSYPAEKHATIEGIESPGRTAVAPAAPLLRPHFQLIGKS